MVFSLRNSSSIKLPILSGRNRFNCVNSSVFQCLDTQCPHYLSVPSETALENRSSLTSSYLKLKTLFEELKQVKNPTFSLIHHYGIKLRNHLKNNLSAFKHNLKEYYCLLYLVVIKHSKFKNELVFYNS